MSKNLFNKYIWIIDTIRRHGAITRTELNRLWMASDVSDGNPIPRRTFYNYRNAIEELFHINIQCNSSTFEYYIEGESENDPGKSEITDWMLHSASLSNLLSDAHDITDRIFVEEVPSARQFLGQIISALKQNQRLEFGYLPFTRSGDPKRVVLEPYFLKIFKQRWYVTGRTVKEGKIKTYALERMSNVSVLSETFLMPWDFDARDYFRNSFGIVFNQSQPKKVTLRVEARQAKYFRALPLHHSQSEMIDNGASIFTYYLKLTPDFVQELLGYGPSITVLGPPELKAMVVESLKASLENYQKK